MTGPTAPESAPPASQGPSEHEATLRMIRACAAHQDVDACYGVELSGQESTPFAPTADLAPTDQGVEGADRTWATVNEPAHRMSACE